jgi:hypothetical protein
MPDLSTFDPKRRLVLTSDQLVNGHELSQGRQIAIVDDESDQPGELTEDQAGLLYQQGTLIHSDRAVATPVETPEQYAGRATEVEELDNGNFLIRAPWLGEGEIVPASKLDARRQEIVDQGAEAHRQLIEDFGPSAAVAITTGTDGFGADDKGNGNFEITGPGIAEPIKIRGKANAEAKISELRAAAAELTLTDQAAGTGTVPGSAEVEATAGEQGGQPITDPAAQTVIEPPPVA